MNRAAATTARDAAKRILRGVCTLLVLPVYLIYYVFQAFGDRDSAFSGVSQLFSLLPGAIGSYLRTAFYALAMENCDSDIYIGFGVLFSQQSTEIEPGVYIGPQCNIGLCRIEKNVLLGSGVHLLSGKRQHNFSDPDVPVQQQGGAFSKITVGEDSWIGNGAIVMASVGRKCVVGAGSVVTNPIEDLSIVAGNPAVVVGKRG